MMRARQFTFGVVLAAVMVAQASADPVEDNVFNNHKAGWYAVTPAAPICATRCAAEGVNAEYEPTPSAVTKRSFVCKTKVRGQDGGRKWLYGTQFNDRPVCYITDLNLKGQYLKRYSCLCVR